MVKCANCGFLAQRTYRGKIPQGFIDVEETTRETGELPTKGFEFGVMRSFGEPDLTPEKMNGDKFPTCFSRAFNLENEIQIHCTELLKTQPNTVYATAVNDIIHKDRECNPFVKWERGFTPKEHREMRDRERQRASDKRWHLLEIVVIAIATIAAGVVGYFLKH
jgi:hypothetical protein